MPRTTEQNEIIRQATHAAIIDSAMTLFAQQGYAHTTTRQIADNAGISAGLMYHYFDGKESLLQAVLENCMEILSTAFSEAYRGSETDKRVATLVQTIFTMLESDRDFWALFYMLRSQPAIMQVLGNSFRLWATRLRDLFINELRGAGRAEPEVDAYMLYSLVEGTIQQYLLDPDDYLLDVVSKRIVQDFT
jgi:AcrR family transcriptional regulator